MEIKITGTPKEIKELLQAIESSKEQNINSTIEIVSSVNSDGNPRGFTRINL